MFKDQPLKIWIGLSSLLLLSLISGGISPAQAQVRAELLTLEQSAMPGGAITAVLKLDHDPKWHTYWTNPGIGEPTRMDWTLPPGWVAGEIDWPVPRQIYGSDGRITGYGYEDVLHLPVRLIVPPTAEGGKEVTLTAKASWLMCEVDICIPGGQTVAVTLPVASTPPKEEGEVKEALAATPMPEAGEGVRVRASLAEADVTLLLEGISNTAKAFKDPYFYSLDGLVYHDTDQLFQASSDGLAVQLEKDSYYNGPTDTLMGVLAFTDQAGAYRGIFINAPFEATPLSLPQVSLAPADEPQKISRWFKALIFALLGGIILNLMPCVLPILSLKALSLAKMRDASPKTAQNDGLAYTAGILVSFLVLAIALLGVRATLGGVGWGFQLQNPLVVLGLSLVMAMVGFNLVGLFEVSGRFMGVGQTLTQRGGKAGSFFTGVLAVVVAAPCTAPFMAAATGFALTQPPMLALSIFMALGLGLALPYLLLAFLPAARGVIPKPGAWMVPFRQVLAFPMFATAIWLLWVYGNQQGTDGMALGLGAVLLLAITLWALRYRHLLGRLVTVGGAALILIIFVFEAKQISNPQTLADPMKRQDGEVTQDRLTGRAYTKENLESLLATGEPVFAYFTADWCVTCKVNERVALHQQETADFFAAEGIKVMVGDWTQHDPEITSILAQYERAGVPMYLYYPPGAAFDEGVLLPQILTPGIVKSEIKAVSS